jgi:hypothetical protein
MGAPFLWEGMLVLGCNLPHKLPTRQKQLMQR